MSVVFFIASILFGLICYITGLVLGERHIIKKATDGKCFQLPDGEMYLSLSEEAQIKLVDPNTKILIIRVEHREWEPLPGTPTRNEQPL